MYFTVVGILLLLRIGLFIYFVAVEGQYLRPDSELYMTLANNLIEHNIFSGSLEPPFEINAFRTPGYPFFLAFLKYIGVGSPYWVIFWQELIYVLCLWFFYHYSQPLFGKKIAQIGLLFLILEPSGIAYPKLILSEIIFLPFIIMGLLFIGHYLQKKELRYLILSGFILGIGIFIRPALLYFPFLIFLTLIVFDFFCKQRWLHATLFFLTISIVVSPWFIRNYQYSGKLFFSGQQNTMLAYWHVPFVWETAKGIPLLKGQKIVVSQVHAIKEEYEKLHGHPLSVIEVYKVQQDIALKELIKYPAEYCLQWFYGFFKTSVGVNIASVYYTLKIDSGRMDIMHIQEVNFYKKIWAYLKLQDKLILFALGIRVIIAVFAFFGVFAIIKRKDCFLWIIMLANFYFLFLPGPMGLPRFRFPIEVFWFVQAYFGYVYLLKKCQPPNEPIIGSQEAIES